MERQNLGWWCGVYSQNCSFLEEMRLWVKKGVGGGMGGVAEGLSRDPRPGSRPSPTDPLPSLQVPGAARRREAQR